MADLRALDELRDWMRTNGATSVRVGDIALTLGPPPPVVIEGQPDAKTSPEDDERRELEDLLPGQDVSAFLPKRAA